MSLYFNRSAMKPRRMELRKNQTVAEQVLWEHIRKHRVADARFRRQVSIGAMVVDFYCPRLRLVIEVDGSIHDTPQAKKNDRLRQSRLEALHLRVIRFTNDEVLRDIQSVLTKIETTVLQQQP